MTRRQTRISTVVVGQGVLGLALGLPISVTALTPVPSMAQEAEVTQIQEETATEIEVESPRVLISEVVIEGLDGHPELDKLQVEAYDAMQVRPGSRVTREELQRDLNAIQATGWFSDVRITPIDGPLGVQLIVQLEPFPPLTAVNLDPSSDLLPQAVIEDSFSSNYGRTLNLNDLQLRMKALQGFLAGEAIPWLASPVRRGSVPMVLSP